MSCCASADVGTKGFSTSACLPDSRADFVKWKWVSGVVVITIMSIEGSANISSAEWYIFAEGWSLAASSLGLGVRWTIE